MGDQKTVELVPIEATIESFAPYGVLPPFEGDGKPTADLEFLLNDGWVNFIGHTLDELDVVDGALHCDVLNRHDTHTQALLVTNCDAVVAVAPASVDFSDPADVDSIRAFALRPGDCFVLHRGTWHWGPFPVGADPVRLLNVQGRRYSEDNASVDLPARIGTSIEVKSHG